MSPLFLRYFGWLKFVETMYLSLDWLKYGAFGFSLLTEETAARERHRIGGGVDGYDHSLLGFQAVRYQPAKPFRLILLQR